MEPFVQQLERAQRSLCDGGAHRDWMTRRSRLLSQVKGDALAQILSFKMAHPPEVLAAVSPKARVCTELLASRPYPLGRMTLDFCDGKLMHTVSRLRKARCPDVFEAFNDTAWWLARCGAPLRWTCGDEVGLTLSFHPLANKLQSLRYLQAADGLPFGWPSLQRLEELHCSSLALNNSMLLPAEMKALHDVHVPDCDDVALTVLTELPNLLTLELPGSLDTLNMWAFNAAAYLHELHLCRGSPWVDGLQACTALTKITLSGCGDKRGLDFFAEAPHLKSVELHKCTFEIGRFLLDCHSLEQLTVRKCPHLSVFPDLNLLERLTELTVEGCRLLRLDAQEPCLALRRVRLRRVTTGFNLSFLTMAPNLQELAFERMRAQLPHNLHQCVALKSVSFIACKGITDITALSGLPNLHALEVRGSPIAMDATPFSQHGLEVIRILHSATSVALTPLFASQCLRVLDASNSNVTSIAGLGRCDTLETVNFSLCSLLTDLSPLAGARRLSEICASESGVCNIAGLNLCPSLQVVDFSRCSWLACFTPLSGAPRLRVIKARHSAAWDVSGLDACPALYYADFYYCGRLVDMLALAKAPRLRVFYSPQGTLCMGRTPASVHKYILSLHKPAFVGTAAEFDNANDAGCGDEEEYAEGDDYDEDDDYDDYDDGLDEYVAEYEFKRPR